MPATHKAVGGPAMKSAETYGIDKPYPQNYVFRCDEHRNNMAFFGKPWGWKILI